MRVTTVVPIYRWPLPVTEQWALATLLASEPSLNVVAVGPEHLEISGLAAPYVPFPSEDFASRQSYSKLLLSLRFYQHFEGSDWVLITQTDAVWLGGDLLSFASGPSDYIGAPWLRTQGVSTSGFSRVGNGGLSLRRVDRFLRVLRGDTTPAGFLDIFRCVAAPDLESLPLLDRLVKSLRLWRASRRGVEAFVPQYTLNEDRFWSDRATVFDRDFKVAPVEEGLRFAFEEAPRLAYEVNGRRLPLGGHAWQIYDPDFWYEMVPGLPGRGNR